MKITDYTHDYDAKTRRHKAVVALPADFQFDQVQELYTQARMLGVPSTADASVEAEGPQFFLHLTWRA